MRSLHLVLLVPLLLAPAVLTACGEDKVTREEAAECERAVRVLDAGNWITDGNADWKGAVKEAESGVRAKCDPRTFPVAVAAAEAEDRYGNALTVSMLCEGDPYRETNLCRDLPQAQ